MEKVPRDTKERAPPRVLEELLDTLGWLTVILHERSFGIIMLFLGLSQRYP